MPAWLIVGLVIVLLLLAVGAGVWWSGQTGEKQSPRLDLSVHPGSGTTLRTTSVRGREDFFTVKMTNTGRVPTTIEHIYLEVPDGWQLKMNASFEGRSLLHGDRPLPCLLGPGESVSYGVPGEPLMRQLAEMGVQFSEQPVTLQVVGVDGRVYRTTLSTEELSQ